MFNHIVCTLYSKEALLQDSVAQLLVLSDGLWYKLSWLRIVFPH